MGAGCVCARVHVPVCVVKQGDQPCTPFCFLCSALQAVVTLLLCGQLCAVETGNETTSATDDGCPKPPEVANSLVEHSVRYQCKIHYRLRAGDGVYTLNSEKRWVNKDLGETLPECEAVCGKPKHPLVQVQRIIGGSLDVKGSFPWQAKMVSRHNLTSGATLINEQWLLTTAKNLFLNHTNGTKAKDIAPTLRLYVGKKQLVEIEKVVLHPDYSKVDIGLIKLRQKVTIGERVMPICLPSKDYVDVNRVGYVAGWGRNANFNFTELLKYVALPVADQAKCVIHYEGSTVPEKKTEKSPVGVQPILNEHTFCAGLTKYQEDTCYGDAGSAFAVHDKADDTWYAAGILSFDKSCAVAQYGVYVKVLSILDWVQKTIADN
ncbi:haptoglobin-like [Hippopotamus amphibius kiboko]|uniref:haptoglobin-like n=1 Tax=Hippopotamus amphibius kiboko TaxID=575201 RepID=UPI002593245A|nr:haptoglobin-like [Hippopotamus amphibius kiboko]